MFPRRYLQNCLVSCSILVVALSVSVTADEEDDVNALFSFSSQPHPTGNETDYIGKYSDGYAPDASSNEVYDGGKAGATPALSALFPSGILSGYEMGTEAKPVVTITPSPASVPSMIITATQVTLGHRALPVDSSKEGSDNNSTNANLIAPLAQDDSSSASSSSSAQINISGGDGGEDASKSQRQSRYQRLPDNVSLESVTEPTITRNDLQDQATEYYKELEGEGGNSYGDNYLEESDHPEQLPTPMALINPNGEGNNPPLEEDFAEAFKKGNPNGKRRRFRGSRKNRMKLKKLTEAGTAPSATDSNQTGPSSPSSSQQEQTGIPTPSPLASTPKFKRVRSTTPTSMYIRAPVTTESSVIMESSIQPSPPPPTTSTTVSQQQEEQDTGSSVSIVRNGPKPMILQSMINSDSAGVTQSPQIEKPSANTEKISTYFFSTPAPSARLRLRQNMRQTQPSTTTTTEAPAEEDATIDEDIWKDEFKDFHKTSFFSGPAAKEDYKIPSFVPMNLGLESDDRQDPVENSLTRPDTQTQLENKAYSIIRHDSDVGIHHRDYESYSGSSSTPKSRKVKRPTSTTYDYDTHSHISPTTETEKAVSSEYYNAQGSNTEPSTTFPSSLRAPTTAGSHYDRTKDRVIFYNDSPYSAHHGSVTTTAILGEFTVSPESSPGSSQTVGTHFAVAEGPGSHDIPLSSTDHYEHNPPHLSMYTRGQVYPPEDTTSQLESTFRNGPPDSSHIHSPNMVEHSTLASLNQYESPHHLSPNHNPYAHTYMDSPQPSAQRPGGAIYGTVEEVPAHGENPYEHHSQHQTQGPSDNGPIPYPYGFEHHPGSHPHAHAMQYPPHYPPSGAQSLPPQPPMLPPQPSNHPPSHYYSPQQHQEISNFSPSPYDIHADVSQQSSHEAQFSPNPNHIAESPSNPNSETPPAHHASSSQESLQQAAEQPSDVISPPQEAPFVSTNSVGNDASSLSGQDQQSVYGGQQQLENDFPPHAHTMAVHPDYEPANPPLPHDHPFHNNFIPFPTQDLQGDPSAGTPEQEHDHLPNSISELGGGPFHPGIVENVPTGSPPFEPSPQIPVAKPPSANGVEFTPIPDDVKENDLFHSYANKPPPPQYDNSPPHAIPEHEIPPHMYGSLENPSGNEQQHQQEHSIHMNDPSLGYIGPTGHGQQNYNPYGPSGNEHGKELGYSGPVTEIHSGPYQQQPANPQGQSYQHHEQPNNIHFPPGMQHDHQHHPEHFKLGELRPEFKPNDLGQDRPPPEAHPHEGGIHGPGPHQRPPGSNGQDGKPPHGAFSNTPYVLMFPQLIPEEQMRPSPPTLLSKEIPVVQASSMSDFTSVSGEKAPLGPGLQAVRVHPRDQMYQVLAKAHYDKMMDKYMESKKRAPSAIYTPYGILVPVGTNVEAATSMPSHNPFPKQRPPPKFRGEKSLLSALLGSPSNTNGRFQHPNMGNRLNKIMEYEPAIDLLAERLAMKLVAAQQTVPDKSNLGNMVAHLGHELMMAEKIDEGHHPFDPTSKNTHMSGMHNHMMEGPHAHRRPSPELKDYLKGVLKGQFHQIVDRAPGGSIEEPRRPMSLSAKLINSIFRKGRLNFPPPKSFLSIPSPSMMMPTLAPNFSPSPPSSPNMLSNGGNIMPGSGPTILSHIRGNMLPKFSSGSMMPSFGGSSFIPNLGGMMASASNVVASKVPPPPGISSKSSSAPTPGPTRHSSHYHGGIGHPFPPIFPQGAAGLLGSIKRFFSFGQHGHFDGSMPIFGGRTLFTGGSNSTRLPFLDGPSPRSSFQKFSQQQPPHHPNMIPQKFPIMVQQQQQQQQQQHHQQHQQHQPSLLRKMISMTAPLPPMYPPPFHNINFNTHNNNNNINNNNNNNNGNSSINSNNRNTMTPPAPKPMKKQRKKSEKKPTKPGTDDGSNKMQNNRLNSSPHQQQMQTPPPPSSTTTSNPKLNPSSLINKTVISKQNATSSGRSPPTNSKTGNSKNQGKDRHPLPQSRGEPTSSDKYQLVITKKVDQPIKKRKGSVAAQNETSSISPSSTPSPPSSSSTPSPTPPKSSKLSKLDMFQTLLGSTRSVLNYFKSEARKSSPTVLKPIATNEETSSYS